MKFNIMAIVVFFIIGFIIGAVCWTYSINTWLVFLDKTNQIAWWQGGLIGFVPWIGQFGLVVAIVTWILMLFLI